MHLCLLAGAKSKKKYADAQEVQPAEYVHGDEVSPSSAANNRLLSPSSVVPLDEAAP